MTVVLVAEYDAAGEFIGDGRDSSTSYTYSTSTSTGTGSTTTTTVEVPPQTVVEGSTEGMVEDRTEDTVPADKDESSSASTVPCTIYPVQPYHSTTSTTITGMAAMGDVPTTETFYSSTTEAETYNLQVQVGITRQDTMADSVDPVLTDLASRLDTRISPTLVVAIAGGSCDASEITFATTTSEAAVAVVAREDGVVVVTTAGNHNNRPTTRPTQTFSPTQTYSPTHTYSPTITPYPTTATYRPTAVMLDPVVDTTSETTKNTAIRGRKQRRHLQEGSSNASNNKATLAVTSVWTCGTFSFFFFLF